MSGRVRATKPRATKSRRTKRIVFYTSYIEFSLPKAVADAMSHDENERYEKAMNRQVQLFCARLQKDLSHSQIHVECETWVRVPSEDEVATTPTKTITKKGRP